MATSYPHQILLIPGFFGFGSFGRPGGPQIVYFDRVIKALESARRELRGRIHVHEPPPIGSLEARVRSLQDALLQLLGGALLRGESERGRRPRIHVIGHSTGGLDVRLLLNPRYHFKGEDPALRERLLGRIGTVVTLSAPHHGTPIARSLVGGLYHVILEGMSLATIAADAAPLGKGVGVPGLSFLVSLVDSVAPRPKVNAAAIAFLSHLDDETVSQIARFRGMLISDKRLLHDLVPERMAQLNARIGTADVSRLVQIVTVAPKPAFGLDSLDRRAVYALCYAGAANRNFRPSRFPEGPWIAASLPGTERAAVEDAPRANDGIVPASSQTLAGTAARLVLADHLDVIGHFEWRWNTTLFKSGARFGRREFEALWGFVARAL